MKRFAALLCLSACGGPPSEPVERVECAVDGAADFTRVCTVERSGDGRLTVRSPSGSFRRLAKTGDGRGVVAADGAEPALVRIVGPDLIEVSVGSDRYRLPATVR